jgi:hypothetical protein
VDDASRLRSLEDSERGGGTTEVEQATAAGGDVLVMAGTRAKEMAELVVPSTEALRRVEALEAPHTSRSTFDAPMVLRGGWPKSDRAISGESA